MTHVRSLPPGGAMLESINAIHRFLQTSSDVVFVREQLEFLECHHGWPPGTIEAMTLSEGRRTLRKYESYADTMKRLMPSDPTP